MGFKLIQSEESKKRMEDRAEKYAEDMTKGFYDLKTDYPGANISNIEDRKLLIKTVYLAGMQDPQANEGLIKDMQDTIASLNMSVDFLRGLRLSCEQRLNIKRSDNEH
jgi:hypothetical protein